MTKKFICKDCDIPCILEVDDIEICPMACPYEEHPPNWRELIEE